MNIDIGDLGDKLNEIVQFYGSRVLETLNTELAEYAGKVRDEVEGRSPVLSILRTYTGHPPAGKKYQRRRGRYRRGWVVKEMPRYGTKYYIIHNKTDWQLTHLLEYGAVREKQGVMPAQPHIAPSFDSTVEEFWTDLQYKLGLL